MPPRTTAFFLLLVALFVFPGCGRATRPAGGPATVKVAFWGSPDEIEIITSSLNPWQAAHPDIQIDLEHTPFQGYAQKVLTRVAGGVAPDVIAAEVNMFVDFATRGVLMDLAPLAEKDASFDRSDFFPEVLDRFTYQGQLLAVPRDTAPFACVYYNQDLFDREGLPYPTDDWTWSQFLELAQRLTKRDAEGRATQYGFYGWAWQNFVYGNGGSLVDDVRRPRRATLDDPKTIAGLQFYADLINKHRVMPTPVALANLGMPVDIMFSSGRVALFLSGFWETPTLRHHKFRWDVVMFPRNDAGVRGFGTGGTGYAMLKTTKNPEAAWEVLKALSGPESQAELARRGLAQPGRISVAQGPAFGGDTATPPANRKMLNDAVTYARYDPFHPKWREIEAKVLQPEFDLLFNGKETAEAAVRKLTAQVNTMLAQER